MEPNLPEGICGPERTSTWDGKRWVPTGVTPEQAAANRDRRLGISAQQREMIERLTVEQEKRYTARMERLKEERDRLRAELIERDAVRARAEEARLQEIRAAADKARRVAEWEMRREREREEAALAEAQRIAKWEMRHVDAERNRKAARRVVEDFEDRLAGRRSRHDPFTGADGVAAEVAGLIKMRREIWGMRRERQRAGDTDPPSRHGDPAHDPWSRLDTTECAPTLCRPWQTVPHLSDEHDDSDYPGELVDTALAVAAAEAAAANEFSCESIGPYYRWWARR